MIIQKRTIATTFLLLIISFQSFSQRRMVAEWEPAYGTLIRWPLGIPGDLVVELARTDTVFVLVENANQQSQATYTFSSYGVNMNHCRFIMANTYSHWTRDWGPHYIFDENGLAGIADPMFNGYPWVPGCNLKSVSVPLREMLGYEEDDAVNIALAEEFRLPLISFPAYLTGGNIMTDGQGRAFSTRQMLDESAPFCNEVCFRTQSAQLLGIQQYFITENPEVHGIQHIDCYAKFLDEERILVKDLPANHPEYACVRQMTDFMASQISCYGRPYEIHRIFCPVITGHEVAAYTNSLIINKKVLVPLFGIPQDEQALQTYRDLMPGYEVIGFTGSWYYYDALHCRTMGIFDPHMLVMRHKQPRMAAADFPANMVAMIDDRSETGLIPESLNLYWREQGNIQWRSLPLQPIAGPDSLYAQLPAMADGSTIQYYFAAADSSGREETLPRTAPAGYYTVEFTDQITSNETLRIPEQLSVFPVPFSDRLHIQFTPFTDGEVNAQVFDIAGRKVWESSKNGRANIITEFIWEAEAQVSGFYSLRITFKDQVVTKKIMRK
ncbi:MAG: hypothetical protein CVT94_07635 [Bacteroidetes bacterium HGW-Bacteroidetes-11]|jgi:agmatine/peptidylarginine deiminase|nr:MAG: hypothetical protein CVT94_07635 [Bacteroidetes bacterium HGW-Bacteroidetes-11]